MSTELDQHCCLCECAATADSSLCSIHHINVASECNHTSDIVCGYTVWEQQLHEEDGHSED